MANKTFLTIAKYHARCRRRRPVSSETLLKNCHQFLTTFFPSIVWSVCVRLTWLYDNMTETTCSEREKKFFSFSTSWGFNVCVRVSLLEAEAESEIVQNAFCHFLLKKKKILPSGVLFFTLQDTQCRAFRYFYSDFLYPKTRTQSLTILPTNPWRDDIKNCPARNGSKNLFFFFAYSNRIQREENWLKPN
jgi:hypothetical protein